MNNPQALSCPEVLGIVLSFLDLKSLLATATVCRAWNELSTPFIWRRVSRPQITPAFMRQILQHGIHVKKLDLILQTDNMGYAVVPTELNRILKATPRLTELSLGLSEGGTPETTTSILRVIQDLLSTRLDGLALDIGNISRDQAHQFFSTLSALRKLELTCSATEDVMDVTFSNLGGIVSIACHDSTRLDRHFFGDATLTTMARTWSNLKSLIITSNMNINAAGLVSFAEGCSTLTRLDLRECTEIQPAGFVALIEASEFLVHVDLSQTKVGDDTLAKMSLPTRRSRLRTLIISTCTKITDSGVRCIVDSCDSLRELDVSDCPYVLMDVFADPAWESRRLETLAIGGIHEDRARIGQSRPRKVTPEDITLMYRQIGKQPRLVELDITRVPFQLHLFDQGREAVESLRRLETLILGGQMPNLSDKELIWLSTQIPSLKLLEIDSSGINTKLVQSLKDINKALQITLAGNDDIGMDDGDSDGDDDEDDDEDDDDDDDEDDDEVESEIEQSGASGSWLFGSGGGTASDLDSDSAEYNIYDSDGANYEGEEMDGMSYTTSDDQVEESDGYLMEESSDEQMMELSDDQMSSSGSNSDPEIDIGRKSHSSLSDFYRRLHSPERYTDEQDEEDDDAEGTGSSEDQEASEALEEEEDLDSQVPENGSESDPQSDHDSEQEDEPEIESEEEDEPGSEPDQEGEPESESEQEGEPEIECEQEDEPEIESEQEDESGQEGEPEQSESE